MVFILSPLLRLFESIGWADKKEGAELFENVYMKAEAL
jgi:hypothetical protein